MKNIYIFFLLISFYSFSQKEYRYSGYYIQFGYILNNADSVVNYRIGNIIFEPYKKLTTRDFLKINKCFKVKKDFFSFLKKKGVIYYIIPKINNIDILKEYYDIVEINKITNKEYKNWDCISFLPDNVINYIEIEKIKFNGLKENFEQQKLIEIFPQLKNSSNLPVMIVTEEYLSTPNKPIIEMKNKTKVYFDFTFEGVKSDVVSTIMIFDCEKSLDSSDMSPQQ